MSKKSRAGIPSHVRTHHKKRPHALITGKGSTGVAVCYGPLGLISNANYPRSRVTRSRCTFGDLPEISEIVGAGNRLAVVGH